MFNLPRPTSFLLATMLLAALLAPVCTGTAAAAEPAEPLTLENSRLHVSLDPQVGTLRVLDRTSGREWFSAHRRQEGGEPRFRDLHRLPGPAPAAAFEADFGSTDQRPNTLQVTLRLADDASDLWVEADMPERDAAIKPFAFLDPLVTESDRAVIAVADYGNGHLYPANTKTPMRSHFSASRLDMPWVGVCDLEHGAAYMVLVDTSDDGYVTCRSEAADGPDFAAPQVHWAPSQGKFAYARKLLYHFAPRGGYVTLAKRYRAYAAEHGLLVKLADKLAKNPNLERLFGAPDLWGDASLQFARQAKAAGVDKMLIHGRAAPADMKAINQLGYLTSEYDNYTDVLPIAQGKSVDSSHDRIPESVVQKADGERMTAWLTFDKKQQYMKRCPALWVASARVVVPKVLAEQPFLGRFVDVTTAEDLYECYDPNHPLTGGQKRQCGVDLLAFMRSQGLVVGGEHGIWWGVPGLDYIEGMMSGGYASWPAGHLIHPKTKDQGFDSPWGGKYGKWDDYDKWGIGHESRVPLWELVFHDCVVSTWYWGDSSDFLLDAAPEITAKKDAFNILYGTIPLMWANQEGAWHKARDVFLRTYRNTCKLHEAIAGAEMLSHEWVTPDRAVQRTRFSDGTEVAVNFGAEPRSVSLDGKDRLLPQYGFAVKGPKIEQSLVLEGGQPVTTIRTADYSYSDAGRVALAMRREGKERVRIQLGPGKAAVLLPLAQFVPGWDPATTRLYQLDTQGRRTRLLESQPQQGGLPVGPVAEETVIEALCGSQIALADLAIDSGPIAVSPPRPRQGERAEVRFTLRNTGGAAARGIEAGCYADAVQDDRKLAGRTLDLEPGASLSLELAIDTSQLDGARELIVAVGAPKTEELCTANNRAACKIQVSADFARWPHRRTLAVQAGPLDRQDEPVVMPLDSFDGDPASVRVAQCDDSGQPVSAVPAQVDTPQPGRSELCFVLAGKTPAGSTRKLLVLWADR
ncbi:MAG: glycoside hydrolase, partial [Thermoguttaceae bacterium]